MGIPFNGSPTKKFILINCNLIYGTYFYVIALAHGKTSDLMMEMEGGKLHDRLKVWPMFGLISTHHSSSSSYNKKLLRLTVYINNRIYLRPTSLI